MAVRRVALVVSLLGFSAGCYVGSEAPADVVSTRDEEFNSLVLNGPVLQGPVLQGPVLQGVIMGPVLQGPVLQGNVLEGPLQQGPVLNGVNLNGPVLQGPVLQGPVLQGSEFSAKVVKNGKKVWAKGMDFIGSEWELTVGQVIDGEEVYEDYVLRIDDINKSPGQDDVYLYDVVHRAKGSNQWKPLCQDGQGGLVPAIPVANYWNLETGDRVDDPNVFVWACTNAVIAKCVLWGYRPWATTKRCKDWEKGKNCKTISLADHHQACTRMARADYCGNGEPWTVNGTAIDIWDHLSPQVEARATNWFIEAEWNPDGAYCLRDIRHQEYKEQGLYPKCFLDKKGKPKKAPSDCGSLDDHRALLVSAFDKYGQGLPNGDDDDDDDDDDDGGWGGWGGGHGHGHGHGHGGH
ncbi:hypothetical protein SAMN02745121_01702 [Nannocystis exedens]|uniref:ADYC domain-containing protein n=1 Tax=Nannocystis exedens TaxID=54 RepID=A0A1I1VJM5_9BACT|nr:hypothetical protein NAEX_05671 [Nannocystis exedens]SFD83114.1 hypothetical protein SAMN02745121_01702 [Nannocystis exedens]